MCIRDRYWAFPFCILEVKVDMGAAVAHNASMPQANPDLPSVGEATKEMGLSEAAWEPDWVSMLKNHRLILETQKYSKFLSSCAWLYTNHPHMQQVPDYMDVLQSATEELVLAGKQPTYASKNFSKKNAVRRNLAVEPKTWMATERTFIKWLQLASLIFFGALYLDKHDDVSGHKAVSYMMLFVGMFAIVYAYVTYLYRVNLLTHKIVGKWMEPMGPFVIVFILLLSHLFVLIDQIKDDST
eukprot:TRINITY_DN1776_c0_g1_i5.p1 TRINITY_DN1776_c0_g1~~TRINITY_DN1776_c0_g1_i5.p1  ORF type:complete len:241 (-),score=84.93 TRINITY_DN1776_c0_g1_i5:95-817(-)